MKQVMGDVVRVVSVGRKMAAEVLIFKEWREVIRGIAHYGQSA